MQFPPFVLQVWFSTRSSRLFSCHFFLRCFRNTSLNDFYIFFGKHIHLYISCYNFTSRLLNWLRFLLLFRPFHLIGHLSWLSEPILWNYRISTLLSFINFSNSVFFLNLSCLASFRQIKYLVSFLSLPQAIFYKRFYKFLGVFLITTHNFIWGVWRLFSLSLL